MTGEEALIGKKSRRLGGEKTQMVDWCWDTVYLKLIMSNFANHGALIVFYLFIFLVRKGMRGKQIMQKFEV